MKQSDILILGAGLSGLTIAQNLHPQSSVRVLDKSRGVGGRIATRRIEGLGFDHGLPNYPGRHVIGGMVQIAKQCLTGFSVELNQKVTGITRLNNSWLVKSESGEEFTAPKVVLTFPLPQVVALLQKDFTLPAEMVNFSYTSALMGLYILNQSVPASPLLPTFISMAERGLHPQGYVFRADQEYTRQHFESSDEEILACMDEKLKETHPHISIRSRELKKWRYAEPIGHLPYPYYQIAPDLFVAGDAFASGEGVEAAVTSASLLTSALLRA